MFYLLLTDTCSMTYHLHYHKNRDPSLEACGTLVFQDWKQFKKNSYSICTISCCILFRELAYFIFLSSNLQSRRIYFLANLHCRYRDMTHFICWFLFILANCHTIRLIQGKFISKLIGWYSFMLKMQYFVEEENTVVIYCIKYPVTRYEQVLIIETGF